MTLRSVAAIVADLIPILNALAEQQVPPIPFDVEFDQVNQALHRGGELLAFRALEMLILSAYASGLTKKPALQQAPAYIEAVQILQMSGKPLPADLL